MVTVTSLEELGQFPLVIVHWKPYEFPEVPPTAEVVGELGERIITAGPDVWVHIPVPIIGIFPTKTMGTRVQ